MRATLGSYLDDYLALGERTVFAHRCGLRTARTSYGELARGAFRFSRELEERGVAKGDRVILWGENRAEWAVAFFGCAVRGAIAVPLDSASDLGFAARVSRLVEPKLAVVGRETGAGDTLRCPIVHFDDFEPLLSRHPAEPRPAARIDSNDTFEIVFTSGSTAEPKGVQLTHRNMLANLAALEREIRRYRALARLVRPIRFLCLVPMSHVFGEIMGMFVPQMIGGEVHFGESASPARVIEAIERERISVLVAVPRMLDALRERIVRDREAAGALDAFRRTLASERLSHPIRRLWRFRAIHSRFGWRFWALICGGAPLSSDTEEFWDTLGFAVIQGYGMTETASLITLNHPFRPARGSIGRAMPGQSVKLAADGEILVRGENVSPGYWRDGSGGARRSGGWFHTGDSGEMDERGNLYFKGRAKDVIVTSGGMKIHPEDIERALERDEAVKAAAVVSVEGAHGSEPLAALVLRRHGEDVEAIIERANRALAPHQRVRRSYVWPQDDFPRTPTQKIVKRLVVERILVAGFDSMRGADAPPAAGIGEIVSRLGGAAGRRIDPSLKLGLDLKLDSLSRVELLDAVEARYGIELDEAALTEETTLGDIERIVGGESAVRPAEYPYPEWQRKAPFRWLRIALLEAVAMPAARLLGRPSFAANLGDIRGPFVVVSNHVTAVDHALVLLAMPRRMRARTAIAMDGEILRELRRGATGAGPAGRLLGLIKYALVVLVFNVFSMPRRSGFRRSFEYAGNLLDRGYNLLVFPEGRHTTDGGIGPFMPGTGLLVSKLGAPVVPMRLDGLWKLKTAGRRRARPGEIAVIAGEPVRYSPHDRPEDIARDLETRVKSLRRAPERDFAGRNDSPQGV